MLGSIKKEFRKIPVRLLTLTVCAVAPFTSLAATTNTFVFNNTTLAAGAGPVNPANGVTAITGAGLAVGDKVVFDGIVINVPGSTTDGWGSINLNQNGGTAGVTAAALGVLVRTSSANPCSLWVNGVGAPNFTPSTGVQTNRVRIELTATQAGSTTNMDWLVQIDQGITGAFTTSQSGTGVNFNSNSIALTFGCRNFQHLFIQNQPVITVGTPTPGTNTVAAGVAATFSLNLTGGFPRNTTQQWLSNSVPIVGATGATYTTPVTTASYNGAQYSVIVSNQLNSANVVTSSVALLIVRSVPGILTFNFNDVFTPNSGTANPNPAVSIDGPTLLTGDTLVFDAIVLTNGVLTGSGDGWAAINLAAGGFQGVTGAKLGVLDRLGAGPSQLFINGAGSSNPTPAGAPVTRVRIELYPSVIGSTTNMGWSVAIDQNLTGTFLPAVTGTNLTFINNTIPLSFGANAIATRITQNPQAVSVFTGPTPATQVVGVGSPATVGVTVKGWNPAFQWRKNGTPIANATNRNYTLPSATLGDNGAQFTVVVSNMLNSANVVTSSVATITVQIPNNLTWYPISDFTTWDTATANWTTNGGTSQTLFAAGNNVTLDALGYNVGGGTVTVTNSINANATTVSATAGEQYVWTGSGGINAQSLSLTGDGTGALGLQTVASFNAATIDAGSTLQVGYGGINGSIQANNLTNNGTIDFQNASGTLIIAGRLTGSGSIIQDGGGTTILTATNSSYTVSAINAGGLVVASAPNPGTINNNSEFRPDSSVDLTIGNSFTGPGHFYFTGFQKTRLTGVSDQTGVNQIFWSQVTVDNSWALGDTNSGVSVCSGADRIGGLYLSNNIAWLQTLNLEPRLAAPSSAATAPHVSNASGTNVIGGPLNFNTGQGGSQINVEATAGLLTIASDVQNNAANANTLNLQGAATGVWNGILPDSSGVLSVLKRGSGTWLLNGANTYTGTTTVSNGTLVINGLVGPGAVSVQSGATLGGTGVISGPVTIATSGTIAPGASIGALTINNNLTLSAGSIASMEINKTAGTNDQIIGLTSITYGGTLAINNLSGTLTTNDTFNLFSATSYAGAFAAVSPANPGAGLVWNTNTLTTDGTLRITVSGVATNPTNITATVTGGNTLQLAWPTDHTGWTLQVQTNSLSAGLGTNWVRIPSSSTTNQVSIPIVPANGSVFYRLVYP